MADMSKEAASGDSDGFMALFEINKMLGELESGEFPPAAEADKPAEPLAELQAEAPEAPVDAAKSAPKGISGEYKPKYDDYSWIYENEEKSDDFSVSFKNPKEKDDLKSLIDEIID